MKRRQFVAFVGGMFAVRLRAMAQTARTFRIGSPYIADSKTTRPYEESFLQGMREFGFERGRNLVFDVRNCDGDQSRLPAVVDELIALKPDLLLGIEQVAKVIRARTSSIAIVLPQSSDPVAAGLVKSLGRPGGNVTGMAALTESTIVKQIEMLAELLPGLRSIAVLLDPGVPATPRIEAQARQAASAKRASVAVFRAKDREDLDRAFAELARNRPDAVVIAGGSGMMFGNRQFLAESAARLRLPVAGGVAEYADAGALFCYGPSLHAMFRRSASHAARILKGANPAEIPVEQASVFELVLNQRTAKAIGLTFPQSVLLRADRVIE